MAIYELDKSHTTLGFTAKHMVFTTVRGQFGEFEGTIVADGADYTKASGEVTIQAASISTGDPKRDGHLKSDDFFGADKYPTLTFKPTAITAAGGDSYKVTGDLTIREITKPIVLDVTVEGRHAKDAFGKERVALSATGKINRKDWGLNWNMALEAGGVLVSEDIKLEVEAAFVAEAAAAAA